MDNNYNYDPKFSFNYGFPSEETLKIRNSLFRDCTKLGGLLLFYLLITKLYAYIFYYATYGVLTGSITLSFQAVRSYLTEEHQSLVTSTTYSMALNASVTVLGLITILILSKTVLKMSFGSFFKTGSGNVKRAVVWMPACFVVNMIFSLAVSYLTEMLSYSGIAIPTPDFSVRSPGRAAIVLQILYVVVIAPVIEEVIYRGIILGTLSKYGNPAAILLSALAFGLMHSNIPQAASAFAMGILFAVIAINCGSVVPTIIIHSLNNLIANFSELTEPFDIPCCEQILNIVIIAAALVGFYVLFTRYSFLKYDTATALPQKGQVTKAVFSNPMVVLYLGYMVYTILVSIIKVNL